jgi:hypothetical protein
MYDAVKEADPAAAVVLGGCGYDVFSSAPRQFFDHVAKAGRDAFDLFSVHLYGDLDRIPEYLATARQFMQAHGYLKPIVAGEYAGPQPFEFPEVMAVMQETFAAAPSTARTSRRPRWPGRSPRPPPPSPTCSAAPRPPDGRTARSACRSP